MNLYQVLRLLDMNTPIIIFDIENIEIDRSTSKNGLNSDLFEYDVFEIHLGYYDYGKVPNPCFCITIQK